MAKTKESKYFVLMPKSDLRSLMAFKTSSSDILMKSPQKLCQTLHDAATTPEHIFLRFHHKVMCDSCSAWLSLLSSCPRVKSFRRLLLWVLSLMCSPMSFIHLSLSILLKTKQSRHLSNLFEQNKFTSKWVVKD